MKLRLCDACKGKIEGKFIKCCESYMEEVNKGYKVQRLNHIGDLCLECWEKIGNKI